MDSVNKRRASAIGLFVPAAVALAALLLGTPKSVVNTTMATALLVVFSLLLVGLLAGRLSVRAVDRAVYVYSTVGFVTRIMVWALEPSLPPTSS